MVETLLVDDSDAFRRTLRELLAARYSVMKVNEATSLAAALDGARSRRPDLVFVDVRLPDGNGLDLVRGLSAGSIAPRCCVVTAFDLPEYRDAAQRSGARHFLAKASATPAEVLRVVQDMLCERVPVLIVDDDALRRRALAQILQRWPAILPFDANGVAAALRVAPALKPALAFIHEALLVHDARGFVNALRAAHSPVLVVAFHPETSPPSTPALSEAVDDVVRWPGPLVEELARCVRAALAREPAVRSWHEPLSLGPSKSRV